MIQLTPVADLEVIRKDIGLLPGASEEGLRALVSETYARALSEVGTKAAEARLSLPLRQALEAMWGRAATSSADLVKLGEALEWFGEELRRILAEAAVFGSMEAAPGQMSARLGINLRLANPYSRAWAVTRSAEFVRHIAPELGATIREATTRAVVDGWHPTVLAKRLRRTVGLLPQHQAAVDRYEALLLEAKMPSRQAGRLATEYANRLRDYRATNIARTELLTAHNKGQQLTWEANMRDGLIPQTMRRAWIVTRSDAITCPGCRSMAGATTTIDGLFMTPWGERSCPPAHPSCRCTSSLVPVTLSDDESAELLAPWSPLRNPELLTPA